MFSLQRTLAHDARCSYSSRVRLGTRSLARLQASPLYAGISALISVRLKGDVVVSVVELVYV